MVIASGMKELTQDIVSSYDDRAKRVGEIKEEAEQVRGEARGLIKGFQTSRKHESAQLRRDLARGEAERKSGVKKMLKGFQDSRREEGARMRKELAQGVADRRSGVKEMRSDFRKAQTEVRADLKEAAAAWQELAHTMQAKRAGVKAPPKKKKVEVPIIEKEEIPDLEAKLLAAINEHPNGITLAEVADSVGVVPIVLGRASRSLLEKGKIRKEEKLYFPVASE